MVDMDQLPAILQWLSYLFPTTYAAEAMREVLISGWSGSVAWNTLVLLLFSLISIVLILKGRLAC